MNFFVCRHVSIWGFQNRVRPSVCLYPEKRNHPAWLRQYQSYISNWYINGKVFTSITAWEPKKFEFFSKKFKIEFWLVLTSRNHLSFVNVSSTLVIDTSMESSLRALHHGNLNMRFHKIKVAKAWKNSSVRRHFPNSYRYRGSVAVHFRCSLSTMEATSLPAPAE